MVEGRLGRKDVITYLWIAIAVVVLFLIFEIVISLISTDGPRPAPTPEQMAMSELRAKCQTWFVQWCISHPGQETDEYPTYTVKSTGKEYTAKCNDAEMLGDKKCGNSSG